VEELEAEDAGLLLLVDEGRVAEFGEPGVVVEGGVVDAVWAVGADIGGGYAEVLDERGVVGAGAEIADADVITEGNFGMAGLTPEDGDYAGAAFAAGFLNAFPLVVDGSAGGTWNFAGELTDELLERGNSGRGEAGAGDSYVGIEVGDGPGQVRGVVFDPFGGADEAFFFGVPGGDDDSSPA
jgi:hypothetical protein